MTPRKRVIRHMRAVKKSAKNTAKKTVKTIRNMPQTAKNTAKKTVKTIGGIEKTAMRTAKKTVKTIYNLPKILKFTKSTIPNLRYGIIHSQFGYADGVSIVMKQVEQVMTEYLGIPKDNLFYLVGRSKSRAKNITIRRKLWKTERTNQLMMRNFEKGYGGDMSERIENAIEHAQGIIAEFV